MAHCSEKQHFNVEISGLGTSSQSCTTGKGFDVHPAKKDSQQAVLFSTVNGGSSR